MLVVPAINCQNLECVKSRLAVAQGIFNPGDNNWIHIDVSDGAFVPVVTWNEPENWASISSQISELNLEVHLMVEDPMTEVKKWFSAGAKRIIVHLEAIKNIDIERELLSFQLANKNCEIVLAIKPETPVESLVSHLKEFNSILLLAVTPGYSGQKFQTNNLYKIKFLKQRMPGLKIEVDGGINLETAALCKEAGADTLVSASFIFNSNEPKETYLSLKQI